MSEGESKVPDTLHELLGEALDDVEGARKAGVTINMDAWVHGYGTQRCFACLAGAWLIRRHDDAVSSLNLTLENRIQPIDVPPRLCSAMYALDCLRLGYVAKAASDLGRDVNAYDPLYEWPVREYSTGTHDAWMADMRELQAALAERGL